MQQARLQITGRVQGVGYRYSAAREAARLGITGWVRNTFDGAVELVAEGANEQLQELIQWCRRGPHGAHVATVDVTWDAPTGEWQAFQIRR